MTRHLCHYQAAEATDQGGNMAAGRPSLRTWEAPDLGVYMGTAPPLPDCPVTRCPRCGKPREMRSYVMECEVCFSEWATRCFWGATMATLMSHNVH
jgi:hypothetical protein